jgi:hypothetical protein
MFLETIITSFPRNWTNDDAHHPDANDDTDVLKSIHKFLCLIHRLPLESVFDLAQLIVYKCLETFTARPIPYGNPQILGVYQNAIAAVVRQSPYLEL